MKCLVCGKTIDEDAGCCPFCGAQMDDGEEDSLYQSFSEYDTLDFDVILTRISTGEQIVVTEMPSVVGRSSHCDVVVPGNPAIGRKHVEINRIGDHIFVKDLGSRNHTYINDEMIEGIRVISSKTRMVMADEEFIIEVKERQTS